jgi:hypothetical protein
MSRAMILVVFKKRGLHSVLPQNEEVLSTDRLILSS